MMPIVFSTRTCGWCARMKSWLNDHNIQFEEIFVDENAEALKKLTEEYQSMTVPVLVSGENVIKGFKPAELERIFKTS